MPFVYRYSKKTDCGLEYVYVGRTLNLKSRHNSHLANDRWCNEELQLDYMETPSNQEADALETYFIGKYLSEGYELKNTNKTWEGFSETKFMKVSENWKTFEAPTTQNKTSPMNFKKFMKKYSGEDEPIGDLADDMYRDPNFPKSSKFEDNYRYLRFNASADSYVLDAFWDAWQEYDLYKMAFERAINRR